MDRLLLQLQDANRLGDFFEQLVPHIAAHPESRALGSLILPQLFAELSEGE